MDSLVFKRQVLISFIETMEASPFQNMEACPEYYQRPQGLSMVVSAGPCSQSVDTHMCS